jgi:hypothetical protein
MAQDDAGFAGAMQAATIAIAERFGRGAFMARVQALVVEVQK